jgi:hypothetical protein
VQYDKHGTGSRNYRNSLQEFLKRICGKNSASIPGYRGCNWTDQLSTLASVLLRDMSTCPVVEVFVIAIHISVSKDLGYER